MADGLARQAKSQSSRSPASLPRHLGVDTLVWGGFPPLGLKGRWTVEVGCEVWRVPMVHSFFSVSCIVMLSISLSCRLSCNIVHLFSSFCRATISNQSQATCSRWLNGYECFSKLGPTNVNFTTTCHYHHTSASYPGRNTLDMFFLFKYCFTFWQLDLNWPCSLKRF